ncbi:BREX system P-loop protein BrxC [Oceanobacillus arenosus]|uniref:BREX system P-loop protein BrxC n=1 Tax=Oceanobacillus arenosus TaxID=1229153 RepID=A0A3D8PPQ3_9BACI|nr:BREX system P-loop protein BrxC [Oceanobacillus arenosus]RDW17507.1 BREX system P-loop protein BrxC [Oceanobacillus arenosus]
MHIKKMFNRQIDRDIKGVVKVGQDEDANIYQELEEYVVTNELHKHIGDFFAAYSKGIEGSTDKIGVWISGFFGSGKSHFLKILSYLIENRLINGKHAIDFFDDKIHDPVILANLKKAGDLTTDVVLFDIDAKSESDSMADKDSIVKVLNKVFNEMQGFCGAIPWVAEIERNMQKDGVYDRFKSMFQDISGNKWEDAREDFYYEEDAIIEALSKSTQMSEEAARNWFDRAEQDYSISIERFVKRVKEYIDSKGENHHVAFLVDEVGQYIGDNSNAMLNLQTIVHELGRQCKGKAWIAVTSQEDIDSVLSVKGNDFSKIQGRFDTKLSLSSAYVDEVIKKRILTKNEAGRQTLEEVYRKKSSILQNLLTFTTEAEMKKYTSEADFVDVYPFVPYQFNLLQKVFTGVRIHGASGRHLAEGERSLLSAFQESAIRFAGQTEGALVPFSTFYETIETFLDHSIRSVIIHASNNTKLESYDIEVLKVLFLIKYVKELPANLENIATLMVDHIDVDKIELKKKIEKSLSHLIGQTLIQKNGEEYIFLTNDEQDVNREIKNMHVESSEVIQKIGEEIFDGIYKDRKYRYSAKYHFAFNAFIDDRPVRTQSNDIGIRVITPYADAAMDYNASELKMMSMRENNVIVKLPPDTTYLDEMEEILKIQAYLKVKSGTSVSQAVEDIKVRKTREVTERRERITTYLTEALRSAEIYVNSQVLEIQKKNPVDRINDAFRMLIKTLFNKLDHIIEFVDTTKDLQDIITASTQLTMDNKNEPNHLAINEVDNYVARLTTRNHQMTIKHLSTYFAKQPYGWLELDTTALLLKLFKAQEIKLQLNSSQIQLNDPNIIQYVTKRDYVDRVVVKKRERISELLLKNARDLSKEIFGISALPKDEDGLKDKFNELLGREKDKLNDLLANYRNMYYPGEAVLKDGLQLIESLLGISDTATYYQQLRKVRQELKAYAMNAKEVKGFFENQRDIFDEAMKRMKIFENNRTYITDKTMVETVEKIQAIVTRSEPYDRIQELPGLYQLFDDYFVEILERECEPVKEAIEEDLQAVMTELEKEDAWKEQFAGTFRARFQTLLDRLDHVNNLYEAIAMEVESDRLKVRCIQEMMQYRPETVTPPVDPGTSPAVQVDKPVIRERKTKTLSKNRIIKGTKTFQTKQDIDKFVEELRSELLSELEEDTTINLV